MIGMIKAMFSKLPKEYRDEWIAYSALGEAYAKKNYNGKGIFQYFDDKKRYVRYNIGDLIPYIIDSQIVAWYKVLNFKKEGGDRAGWDDGRKYHLKLHSVC